MATLRIRINNPSELERMLPKLRRSLSVQQNIDLEPADDEAGVFLLVIKEKVTLQSLAQVRQLLDAYHFTFHYRTVDINELRQEEQDQLDDRIPSPDDFADDCSCEQCTRNRMRYQRYIAAQKRREEHAAAAQRAKEEQDVQKAMLRDLLQEAVRNMNKAKKSVR